MAGCCATTRSNKPAPLPGHALSTHREPRRDRQRAHRRARGAGRSIDWFCFPHFDSPSVFAAILDDEEGGHFSIGSLKAGTRHLLNRIGKARYYQHVHPAELEEVRLMPGGREVWILKDPSKTTGRADVVTLRGGNRFSVSGLQAFWKGG